MTRNNRKRYGKEPQQTVGKLYWDCPSCGLRVTDQQMTLARANYLCPRCHNVHLSDFKLVEVKVRISDQKTQPDPSPAAAG